MEAIESSQEDEEPYELDETPSSKRPSMSPGGRRIRILLVDDDELTLKILTKLLAALQYEVAAVKDGKEALDLIASPRESLDFDVILTDERMPEMNGTELATHLKESRWSHIPVYLMSSEVNAGVIRRASSASIKEVITKPVRRSFLLGLQQRLQNHRKEDIAREPPKVAEKIATTLDSGSVRPPMKRAVSMDHHHTGPNKKARLMETLLKITESVQNEGSNPSSSSDREDQDKSSATRQVCSLLTAKSLPEAYNIRCYSLPLPFIPKDFLKSPVGSVPKLQIKPLDISLRPFPTTTSKASEINRNQAPLTPVQSKGECGNVAASLSQLHHDHTSSAFQRLESGNGTIPSKAALLKVVPPIRPQMRPPAFEPQKLVQSHQQRFSEAFQAAMKQHKQAEICTANRKAAILRFRAKRQQRSFQKKVRYASRKRLADQRPRIKGQFVKAADLLKSSRGNQGEHE